MFGTGFAGLRQQAKQASPRGAKRPVPYIAIPVYAGNKIFAQTNNQSFFCLLFFPKKSTVKTKTEMKSHLCLLIIRFAQNNYQSFFCLLFFSKKRTVPTFLFTETSGRRKVGGEKTEMKKIISVFVCYSNMTVTGLSPTSILTEAAFAPQKLLLSASSAGVPSTVAEEALPKQSATV